jgi:hypothetical protein
MKTSFSKSSQGGIAAERKPSLKKSKSGKHSSSKSSSNKGRKASSKSTKRESNDDVAISTSGKSSKRSRKDKEAVVVVTPEKKRKSKSESLPESRKSKKRSQSSESRKGKSPNKKDVPSKTTKYNPVMLPWHKRVELYLAYLQETGAENDDKVKAELINMKHAEMIEVMANESTPKELLPAIYSLATKLGISPENWPNLTTAPKAKVVKVLVEFSMRLANQ